MQKTDPNLHSHSIFLNCHDFQSYPNIIVETYGNIFFYQVSCKKKDSKLHSHSSFLNCHDFQSYPNHSHKTMETYESYNGRGKLDTWRCLYPNLKWWNYGNIWKLTKLEIWHRMLLVLANNLVTKYDLNFFSLYALLFMATKVTCTPIHDQIDNNNLRVWSWIMSEKRLYINW
jgi:hypothetical protein